MSEETAGQNDAPQQRIATFDIESPTTKESRGFGGNLVRFVYFDAEKSKWGWYFFDNASKEVVPIMAHSLTGRIIDVRYGEKTYKGDPVPKLRVFMNAEEAGIFMLETGLYTATARTMIGAIANGVEPGQLITIEPAPGEESVFIRMYDPESVERIPYEYAETEDDVDVIFDTVLARFGNTREGSVKKSGSNGGGSKQKKKAAKKKKRTKAPRPETPPAEPEQYERGDSSEVSKADRLAIWNAAKKTGYDEESFKAMLEHEGAGGSFEGITAENYDEIMRQARSETQYEVYDAIVNDDLPF